MKKTKRTIKGIEEMKRLKGGNDVQGIKGGNGTKGTKGTMRDKRASAAMGDHAGKAGRPTKGGKKALGRVVEGFGATEGGVGRDEDSKAMVGLIQALMGWYLDKLNGDPRFEGFDILMMVEGPKGRIGQKFVMGSYEESLARLRQDLETEHAGCERYVYAWRGWWQKPDGEKFDGTLLCLESRHITPGIYGIPIVKDAKGRHMATGDLHSLGAGQWSLLHRSR